jgi:hypothetical protein
MRNLKLFPLLLLVMVSGCASKPTSPASTTPTIQVLADSFFSGYALLDANGNGEIDSEDTPVENATFIVTLQGGGEVGDTTDEAGNAFITIPGGVEYPVTLRMEVPKDSTLKLIGPSSITFPSDEPARFLFSSK